MKVDFFANQRHFLDHLAPIYFGMPEEYQGSFVVQRTLYDYATSVGVNPVLYFSFIKKISLKRGLLVAAGATPPIRLLTPHRPFILLNHGAGQSFADVSHPSYAGGKGRGRIGLFLEPGESPASRDKEAYPRAMVRIIGCPKMDKWHIRPPKPRGDPLVMAIGFHWDCRVCPETRTALPYYKSVLPQLARWCREKKIKLLGHGHPHSWGIQRAIWVKNGIEPVYNFDEILEHADIYIHDQMSTLFEFASLDRPVVVLNAPWYRRDVEHGLRFWECASVGVNCDEPKDLIGAIKEAIKDTPAQQKKRHIAIHKVFKYMDGGATDRAVAAILEFCSRRGNEG